MLTHLLTNEEFNLIHTFAGSGKETIEVGHLANDSLVPVNLGIGKLYTLFHTQEYKADCTEIKSNVLQD